MTAENAPRAAPGADVRIPPPLLYAVPLVLLWLLDRVIPLRMPGGGWRASVGWVLVGSGVALVVSGASTFRRHGTTVMPHHAVSTFVTSGPYRFTRNPMYLGMSTAYIGAALVLGSWWPLLGLPVIVLLVDRFVIDREEAYLRTRFGADYDDFSARTRRWL